MSGKKNVSYSFLEKRLTSLKSDREIKSYQDKLFELCMHLAADYSAGLELYSFLYAVLKEDKSIEVTDYEVRKILKGFSNSEWKDRDYVNHPKGEEAKLGIVELLAQVHALSLLIKSSGQQKGFGR